MFYETNLNYYVSDFYNEFDFNTDEVKSLWKIKPLFSVQNHGKFTVRVWIKVCRGPYFNERKTGWVFVDITSIDDFVRRIEERLSAAPDL
jgi:hypothetical protein